MVKPPKHSKPTSETLTIDLSSEDVNSSDDVNDDVNDGVSDADHKREQKTLSLVFSAGLLGALLTLIGGVTLQWAGILPISVNNNTQTMINTQLTDKITVLESVITELNDKLVEQNTSDSANNMSVITVLSTRMDEIETLVQNDNTSALEALNELNIRLDKLTSRTLNLEQAFVVSDEAGTVLSSGVQEEIADLTSLNASQSSQITTLKERIAKIEQALTGDEKTAQVIGQFRHRMDMMETALAKQDNNDMPVARSLAAIGIKNAIDRGGRFTVELASYQQLDQDNSIIEALKPIAEKGVLSRADLTAQFKSIINEIIASEMPEQEETNVISRLLNSAGNIVKIRKIGDVEGDSVEAIVARMEIRLGAGDFIKAMEEWQSLSKAAQAVSQDYSKQLQARIIAEKLSGQLLQIRPAKTN